MASSNTTSKFGCLLYAVGFFAWLFLMRHFRSTGATFGAIVVAIFVLRMCWQQYRHIRLVREAVTVDGKITSVSGVNLDNENDDNPDTLPYRFLSATINVKGASRKVSAKNYSLSKPQVGDTVPVHITDVQSIKVLGINASKRYLVILDVLAILFWLIIGVAMAFGLFSWR